VNTFYVANKMQTSKATLDRGVASGLVRAAVNVGVCVWNALDSSPA
jgi:hypothetical protein